MLADVSMLLAVSLPLEPLSPSSNETSRTGYVTGLIQLGYYVATHMDISLTL